MPASALISVVRYEIAGVGRGPTKNTSAPAEVMPAERACSNI